MNGQGFEIVKEDLSKIDKDFYKKECLKDEEKSRKIFPGLQELDFVVVKFMKLWVRNIMQHMSN